VAAVTCDASVGAEPAGISPGTGRAGQDLTLSGQEAYVNICQQIRRYQMSADVSRCQMADYATSSTYRGGSSHKDQVGHEAHVGVTVVASLGVVQLLNDWSDWSF
jgi:hypothetical protein